MDHIAIKPLEGVQFTLGPYGIRGLKLLYANDSESSLLGNLCRRNSRALQPTQDISLLSLNIRFWQLTYMFKNLKCLKPQLLPEGSPSPGARDALMWNVENTFSETDTRILEHFQTSRIRQLPRWKFASFTPLVRGEDEEYVDGIMMYYNTHVIRGIVTHGKRDILSATKKENGCAIHLALRTGEITDIFVRRPADPRAPGLSSGRSTILLISLIDDAHSCSEYTDD